MIQPLGARLLLVRRSSKRGIDRKANGFFEGPLNSLKPIMGGWCPPRKLVRARASAAPVPAIGANSGGHSFAPA
jgi:hypothetical protein